MKATTVHPTQQRSSCEGCRKQKARCQRINPEDPKCARCILHKIDCIGGRQKKIGRPKRAPPAGRDARSAKVHSGAATQPHASIAGAWQSDSSTPMVPHHQSATPVQNDASWDGFLPSPPDMGLSSPQAYVSPSRIDSTWHTSYPSPESTFNVASHIIDPASDSDITSEFDLAPPNTDITSYALTTLSLMNVGLYGRLQTAETYKDKLTLELIIGQRGPLFTNNTTLAQFTLNVAHEFLSVLKTLPAGCIDNQKPNPPRVELPTPLSLLITSIFKQLLDLYDLNLSQITPRLDRLETEPVAPFPGPRSEVWQLADACAQGVLFLQMMLQLLNQTEKTLGITWGEDHGEGLLSPRQMHTLWNEISGTLGHGLMRTEMIKAGMKHASAIMARLIDRRVK